DRNVTGVQTCALPIYYHQQHQTIKGACTFKGYITHDALGDLLTDYANTPTAASDAPIARFSTATIYETCRAYYAWGDNTNSPPQIGRASCREREQNSE